MTVEVVSSAVLARELGLSDRAFTDLAAHRELPAIAVGNAWRVRRSALQAWVEDRSLGLTRHGDEVPSDSLPAFPFEDALRADQVMPNLKGHTAPAVLVELSNEAHRLGLVRNRLAFLGALLERESVLTSAVGDGLAFPRPLQSDSEQVDQPFLLFGRHPLGVDFRARDSRRVHFVVLLGIRQERPHVPWLGSVAQSLRDGTVQARLTSAPDRAELLSVLTGLLHGSSGQSDSRK